MPANAGSRQRIPTAQSVPEAIRHWAETSPDAPALVAADGTALAYRALAARMQQTRARLAGAGVGPQARLALVLPSDVDTAVALLGSMAAAVVVCPLSPALTAPELRTYLASCRADAVLTAGAEGRAAREAAAGLGIPAMDADSGVLALGLPGGRKAPPAGTRAPRGRDLMAVFHTSGTTSRPKLVPLTQESVCLAALYVARTLRLGAEDRCLNVMPLFHVHGLVAALMASLVSGGSVVCAERFEPEQFLDTLEQLRPTWYTASPPVHRAVLDAVRASAGPPQRRLRLIRSASTRLPPALMAGLEEAFGVPVIESYGMTEAATQITSNQLPPGLRKPGSAGRADGPEAAVMDDAGKLLPPGATGEVVIRGPSVMAGYEDDEDANRAAFVGGWLRTGDRGHLDEDGFLFLTGRQKEIINCGGENVSPFEVDEALSEHPAVAEAAAFAMPDPDLGEAVAAAVVLAPGRTITDRDLLRFAAGRLAYFKVPRRIHFVDAIPRGGTGKVQRGELAAMMAARATETREPPVRAADIDPAALAMLGRLWADALGVRAVQPGTNFFQRGGNSISAMRLLARIRAASGVEVPVSVFFADPTPAGVARALLNGPQSGTKPSLVRLQSEGDAPPLYIVAAAPPWALFDLAREFAPDQPLCALHPLGIATAKWRPEVEGLARAYLDELRSAQPEGPHLLAGISSGGFVALEMAQILRTEGERVPFLGLIDTALRVARLRPNWALQRRARDIARLGRELLRGSGPQRREAFGGLVRMARVAASPLIGAAGTGRSAFRGRSYVLRMVAAQRAATRRYRPRPYAGRMDLFWAEGTRHLAVSDPRLGWDRIARGGLFVHRVPGDHHLALTGPHVATTARALRRAISDALDAD